MKKGLALIMTAALAAGALTGCGIVKVVPIGQEAAYSGKEVFDSAQQSGSDWGQVVEEITAAAVDLAEVLNGDGAAEAKAVSGKAEIVEFNTDTPKYYLLITPEGYTGDKEVKIQAGGVYSGTAVRDAQTVKGFKDFTNQTEWSQYGKSLNAEVDTQVVAPLALDESNGTVSITPVSMTIE